MIYYLSRREWDVKPYTLTRTTNLEQVEFELEGQKQ